MVAILNQIKSRNATDDDSIDVDANQGDTVPIAGQLCGPNGGIVQHQVIEALSQHDAVYNGLMKRLFDPKDKQPKPHRAVSSNDEPSFQDSVMDSLFDGVFPEIGDREEAIPQAYKDTYTWVFRTKPLENNGRPLWSSFPVWLESKTSSPFWITGKPGSGKSTLMKYMLHDRRLEHHLQKWAGEFPLETTSFFAWISGSNLQCSTLGLMRTVLYQCLKTNRELVAVVAPRRWSLIGTLRNCNRQPQWEDWELHESFNLLLSHIVKLKRVAIFIDGLDEFKIMPSEVLKVIHGLCEREGIKVCIASRQWFEFSDELDRYPMLRMQDITSNDTLLFVRGSLGENRGFIEQRNIYGKEVDWLVDEIVDKSNGVFLWAHLVTRSLLQAFSEGYGLPKLKAILEEFPERLDGLYSKIWSQVEERKSNFARLMALKREADGHLHYLNLWLADDPHGFDMSNLATPRLEAIRSQVMRRLDRNTRGILELSRRDNVEYLHRTASDWADRREIWDNIRAHLHPQFDACLSLLHAEVLLCQRECDRPELSDQRVYEVLRYAHRVRNSTSMSKRLVQILDEFNTDMTGQHEMAARVYGWVEDTTGWTSRYGCNFFELACRYCATPYLDAKMTQVQRSTGLIKSRISAVSQDKSGVSLASPTSSQTCVNAASALENVMLGHKYTTLSAVVPLQKRRDTVELLLDRGATASADLQRRLLYFNLDELSTTLTYQQRVEQEYLNEMMRRTIDVEVYIGPGPSRMPDTDDLGSRTTERGGSKETPILALARRFAADGGGQLR